MNIELSPKYYVLSPKYFQEYSEISQNLKPNSYYFLLMPNSFTKNLRIVTKRLKFFDFYVKIMLLAGLRK
jgi:hypothetical protein